MTTEIPDPVEPNQAATAAESKAASDLAEYRKWLVAAEQKSQEDFDKTVLSLSGGALGISFVFLKDVIGNQPIVSGAFLLSAWIAWGVSSLSVLSSYYLSHLALRKSIGQVDDGTIYKQKPGGVFATLTAWLNATGALLFLVGVCCITIFAGANFSSNGGVNGHQEAGKSVAATEGRTINAEQTETGEGRLSASSQRLHSATPSTKPQEGRQVAESVNSGR